MASEAAEESGWFVGLEFPQTAAGLLGTGGVVMVYYASAAYREPPKAVKGQMFTAECAIYGVSSLIKDGLWQIDCVSVPEGFVVKSFTPPSGLDKGSILAAASASASAPASTSIPIGAGLDRYNRSIVNVAAPVGLGTGFRGSGVVISADPETGAAYILTAYHVVDESPHGIEVSIEGEPGEGFPAQVEAHDDHLDIALLSTCCSPWFLAAEAVDIDYPNRGDRVYAVASNDHGQVVASHGEILGTSGNDIGADVPVEPGYSGGALVTAGTYEVLGIITGVRSTETGDYPPAGAEGLQAFGLFWPPGTVIAIRTSAIATYMESGPM